MADIHQIGADAVKALKALNQAKAAKKSKTAKATELIEERNELARPLLQQVHDHIAGGNPVNGCSTWAAWAKYAGWSKRALNYILNGRKPQTGNSSSRPTLLKELLDVINCTTDIRVVRVKAAMVMGDINYNPKNQTEVDGEVYNATADSTISTKTFKKLVNKPKPKKVKKLTAKQTVIAIELTKANYQIKPETRDDNSREWVERYLQFFEEQVKLHPEWRNQQIETEHHRIEYQIKRRAYADPEVSEPVKALAAAVDGAEVPQHLKVEEDCPTGEAL